MIGIIETGISNFRSMEVSIETLGYEHRKVSSPDDAKDITKLIFPGVGSFKAGMKKITEMGLDIAIKNLAAKDIPILGVCLGMQVLFTSGEEFGGIDGLNLVSGKVIKLDASKEGVTVPNIGWNKVKSNTKGSLDLGKDAYFYHIHSFHAVPTDKNIIKGTIELGKEDITVAIEKDNIFGVQFHPEKSQDAGLEMLHSFLSL
jgi:glutamine amidotransferase